MLKFKLIKTSLGSINNVATKVSKANAMLSKIVFSIVSKIVFSIVSKIVFSIVSKIVFFSYTKVMQNQSQIKLTISTQFTFWHARDVSMSVLEKQQIFRKRWNNCQNTARKLLSRCLYINHWCNRPFYSCFYMVRLTMTRISLYRALLCSCWTELVIKMLVRCRVLFLLLLITLNLLLNHY